MGQIKEGALTLLSTLTAGKTAIIKKVQEEKELLDYLQTQGIEIGSQITVLSVDDYEGPFTLTLGDKKIRISHKAACQIYVAARSET